MYDSHLQPTSTATSKRTLRDGCASGVREMRKRLSCLQCSILSKFYCNQREVKHCTRPARCGFPRWKKNIIAGLLVRTHTRDRK